MLWTGFYKSITQDNKVSFRSLYAQIIRDFYHRHIHEIRIPLTIKPESEWKKIEESKYKKGGHGLLFLYNLVCVRKHNLNGTSY